MGTSSDPATAIGQIPPPEWMAESKRLHQALKSSQTALAREQFDALQMPSVVLSSDADTVTCRLPRDVIRCLLLAHESGMGEEEQMTCALDSPELMRTLKVVLELTPFQR